MKEINMLCKNTTDRTSSSLRFPPVFLAKTARFVIRAGQNRHFPGVDIDVVPGVPSIGSKPLNLEIFLGTAGSFPPLWHRWVDSRLMFCMFPNHFVTIRGYSVA